MFGIPSLTVVAAVSTLGAFIALALGWEYYGRVKKRQNVRDLIRQAVPTVAAPSPLRNVDRTRRIALAVTKLLPERFVARRNRWLLRAGYHDLAWVTLVVASEVALASAGVLWIIVGNHSPLALLASIAATIGLWFTPRVILHFQAEARADQMTRELPSVVDLMHLAVGAGLGLSAALSKVVDAQQGAVVDELSRTLDDLALGISRADAFGKLADRTASAELARFADAINKVDQLGVSLTSVLEEQAAEMRYRRRTRAREKAQRVSVQILLPLVLCFLPGLFIVVLGPGLLRLMDTLGL